MVDGVLLLVDASEGPLPQTRFVLRKALAARLPIILVVNKVDRPDARIKEVVDDTYELFLDLDADESQIDFPIVYACARDGRSSLHQPPDGGMPDSATLQPLFATLLDTIPPPSYVDGAPLQAHVTNLDASPFLGRLALCRVDEPAISMTIGINTSPLAGRTQGGKVTARLVEDRLERELVGNVSLRVLPTERPDTWEVQGRGELALAILVEQMRRESYALSVGKPRGLTRLIDGTVHEPVDRLAIDVPEDYLGVVNQLLVL